MPEKKLVDEFELDMALDLVGWILWRLGSEYNVKNNQRRRWWKHQALSWVLGECVFLNGWKSPIRGTIHK